jgi:hypothetical protein
VTKSIEELEREFASEVRRFIDLAVEAGHSLEEANVMARDVAPPGGAEKVKIVSPDDRWPSRPVLR